jgi:hypothetical protein
MARISKKTYQGIGVRDGEKQSVILTEAVKILDATCKYKVRQVGTCRTFLFFHYFYFPIISPLFSNFPTFSPPINPQ